MPLTGEYAPSTSGWARKQAERYEATSGAEANDLRGRPIIVVTSVGARTGKLRKTALMRVEHEGQYAVVASLGGSPRNPARYHNLRVNPHVELQDRATTRDYVAHEATGAEKASWWQRAVETWPDYARYQKATDRQIPLFVLEPMDEGSPDSALYTPRDRRRGHESRAGPFARPGTAWRRDCSLR